MHIRGGTTMAHLKNHILSQPQKGASYIVTDAARILPIFQGKI